MKLFRKQISLLLACSLMMGLLCSIPVSAASSPAKIQKLKCKLATQNSINLSWQEQTGISGYQLYRATCYDGKYKKVMNINPQMHVFCNKNLKSGREYYYKVRAYTGSGKSIRYGKFSNILAAHTKLPSSKSATPTTWVNIRKHAGTNHPSIAVIGPSTKVSVICTTTDRSGQSWSRIQCSVNNRTVKGYIRSNLLKQSKKLKKTGIVTAFLLNVRSSANPSASIVATLNKGQKVTVLGSKKSSSGTTWYQIRFTKGGRTKTGYASAKYIKIQ